MCTLSWLPTANGYWLLFNRDERRTREPGRPPEVHHARGVRILAPVDGDAGGTWIGVNHFGLAAALLNRYHDTPLDPPADSVSRGILLRSLLDARSAAGLTRRLRAMALGRFQPFTIAATDAGGVIRLADWDGRRLTTGRQATPGLVRTSSGRDQLAAEQIRGRVFGAVGGRLSIPLLRALHRSHLPARGPFSVCMHRAEAKTQSFTEIRVTARSATVRYQPGSPCRGARTLGYRLARVRPRP